MGLNNTAGAYPFFRLLRQWGEQSNVTAVRAELVKETAATPEGFATEPERLPKRTSRPVTRSIAAAPIPVRRYSMASRIEFYQRARALLKHAVYIYPVIKSTEK